MVAGGLPTVQVLLDDGTGTFPYDITTKTRIGYDVKRGRQDELSDVTPGELKLTLENTDGRFTPGSTIIASPSPIKADAQIRLKVTANGVTVNRFTGYVQSWPVAWPAGGQELSEVTITAVDAQARAERRDLRSVPEEEILEDSPVWLYTLGEPEGSASAGDTSGNQEAPLSIVGSGAAVVFGADGGTGPGTDGLTAAQFAAGQYLLAADNVDDAGTVGCAFSTSTVAAADLVGYAPDGAVGGVKLSIDSTGHLVATASSLSVTFGSFTVTDGRTHAAHAVSHGGTTTGYVELYLDGTLVATSGTGFHALVTTGQLVVGRGFTGTIAHANGILNPTGARVIAHEQALLTAFAGESGTARLTRTAGYANLPVGTLDASLTNVAFEEISTISAAQALRDVAAAEMGLVFIDGSGNLTFHNRQRVTLKTAPDITIDANQLAEDTAFTTDMQGVINYVDVTAQGTGSTQTVRNAVSEASHGRYPESATYLVQTDAEAVDRANWIVSTHAEPTPRVGDLAIAMLDLPAAQQAQLLAAEPNTWIRVTSLPTQTPGGTTADLIVQGFQDILTMSGQWTLTANAVSKPGFYPSVWILGDATYGVLDSTTRLAV